jgi:hypothetical protein
MSKGKKKRKAQEKGEQNGGKQYNGFNVNIESSNVKPRTREKKSSS